MVLALLLLLASQTFDDTYRAGLIALQKGDLPGAMENLRAAVRLAPANGRARIALAQAYWRSGDPAKAEEAAERAVELAPKDPAVLRALGIYYFEAAQKLLQQQKFGEALRILETARKRLPADPQTELALGVAYYGLRRFDEAADAFLSTIRLAPEIDQPYLFLGKILDQIPNRWPEATTCFEQFEARHPESAAGYLLHAQGLDAQALEPEKARGLLEKSLALDNSNPMAHFELGNVFDRLREYEKAAGEFERAAELNPRDAATHYRLARDYDRVGKHDAADAERRKHAELVKAQEAAR